MSGNRWLKIKNRTQTKDLITIHNTTNKQVHLNRKARNSEHTKPHKQLKTPKQTKNSTLKKVRENEDERIEHIHTKENSNYDAVLLRINKNIQDYNNKNSQSPSHLFREQVLEKRKNETEEKTGLSGKASQITRRTSTKLPLPNRSEQVQVQEAKTPCQPT